MILPVNSGCLDNAAFGVRYVSRLRRVFVNAAVFCVAFLAVSSLAAPGEAAAETRSLPIHFTHTGERAVVTYKKNGRYLKDGLRQLNHLVRDFRRNEATEMDPRLFDLLWEVYQASGSNGYIHVVSGYRSPETNAMLRSRSSGVAKKSQHMLGKAMDFYLSDVPVKKIRELGMKFQVGGVGYYPTSGVPFVHLDVGSVRAWPRMSREELVRLFPDGKTLHLPPSGQKLAGYDAALADYRSRVSSSEIAVAGGGAGGSGSGGGRNLFAMLFGNTGDEDEDAGAIATGPQRSAPRQDAPRQAAPVTLASAAPPAAPTRAAAPLPASAGAPIPVSRPVIGRVPPPQLASLAPVGGQPAAGSGSQFATAMLPTDPPVPPSALDAAKVKQAEEKPDEPAFADLAGRAVPVPEFRADRSGVSVYAAKDAPEMEGRDVTDLLLAEVAREMAAEGGPGTVPRPADRPEVRAIAAATRLSGEDEARGEAGAGQSAPVELASLQAPGEPSMPDPRNLAERMRATVGAVPLKGGRPTERDARRAAPRSVRGEPKLTERMISAWAIGRQRLSEVTTPVKSPRFVSKALRAAPEMAYTAGFSAESVEANRFTGAAVNFLTVARFDDSD